MRPEQRLTFQLLKSPSAHLIFNFARYSSVKLLCTKMTDILAGISRNECICDVPSPTVTVAKGKNLYFLFIVIPIVVNTPVPLSMFTMSCLWTANLIIYRKNKFYFKSQLLHITITYYFNPVHFINNHKTLLNHLWLHNLNKHYLICLLYLCVNTENVH